MKTHYLRVNALFFVSGL